MKSKYLSRNVWTRMFWNDREEDLLCNLLLSCLDALCTKKGHRPTEFYYHGTLVAQHHLQERYLGDDEYDCWDVIKIKKSFLSENKKRLRSQILLLAPEVKRSYSAFDDEDFEWFSKQLLK